jgi:predicted metal-dependent HD superfamily phosphohydrolase
MEELRTIWNALCGRYTDNRELVRELWTEIEEKYSTGKRPYHNLEHLQYMAEKAMMYRESLMDFDTILFSICYHDIVYKPGRQDNEHKSAQIARDRLSRLGLADESVAKCLEQIIATKDHKENADPDTSYLLDMDLAILGESPKIYRAYTAKIRQEYAIYPDFLYKRGRKKVLQHFLQMDRIFKTKDFHAAYEKQARENLEAELIML